MTSSLACAELVQMPRGISAQACAKTPQHPILHKLHKLEIARFLLVLGSLCKNSFRGDFCTSRKSALCSLCSLREDCLCCTSRLPRGKAALGGRGQ